ncbi:tRNA(Ile)-lysidine synthetase [hydrothermal vent metagenome]|uniref:tRNA(Ile)-lysidine synthetase n=1 Tax=hydrothermal vent metagenome TaxID=652676 RepID=A0A3B0W3S5_9ZZZZ
MSFAKQFRHSLETLCASIEKSNYVVAYSGGVDSHVLLLLCKELKLSVRAVHIHHGLQNCADDWVKHCQNTCKDIDVDLNVIYVDAKKKKGESPEETARNVRYQALQECLLPNDVLLTAQHKDDQAETLLLQLFRSASSAGLAGMPTTRVIGEHIHVRPLLSFSRNEIENYAKQNSYNWIEDPSNQDTSIDRNFIRKDVLPLLIKRWPEIKSQLSTVTNLQASNLDVLEDMATIDLANALSMRTKSDMTVFEVISMLSLDKLKALSSSRLLNLLRYWIIKTLQIKPTKNLLEEIEHALINTKLDASPDIVYSGFSFKKFQENLYLIKLNIVSDSLKKSNWNPSDWLNLPELNIRLTTKSLLSSGLSNKLLDESLQIRFRKGGEKFHPAGRRHSQSLKKLFQEANIPPWERDVIPLVYFGDNLIAVGGLWVAKEFVADKEESGWSIKVERL